VLPPVTLRILSQYSPSLILTLHFALQFTLSKRTYFQPFAFLISETSSNWPSLNIKLESTNLDPENEKNQKNGYFGFLLFCVESMLMKPENKELNFCERK
jgi:hypothetical protein